MLSLTFLTIFLILSIVFSGCIMAWAARAVGSGRGTARIGIPVMMLLMAIGALCVAVDQVSRRLPVEQRLVILLSVFVVQIWVEFRIVQRAFRLSVGGTFAPFGALFGAAFIEVAIMLLLVRPFLFQAFVMPTKSMSPTIEEGDRFLVNKRIRPRRLDLVAYWTHDRWTDIYCKRLVGLPGERLRFENGGIYINDRPISLPSVIAGKCHASLDFTDPQYTHYEDGKTIELGADEYFLIGDDLAISLDSRMLGPAHRSDIVGVVDAIYWPPPKWRIVR